MGKTSINVGQTWLVGVSVLVSMTIVIIVSCMAAHVSEVETIAIAIGASTFIFWPLFIVYVLRSQDRS
jgi:hypothetical protein